MKTRIGLLCRLGALAASGDGREEQQEVEGVSDMWAPPGSETERGGGWAPVVVGLAWRLAVGRAEPCQRARGLEMRGWVAAVLLQRDAGPREGTWVAHAERKAPCPFCFSFISKLRSSNRNLFQITFEN